MLSAFARRMCDGYVSLLASWHYARGYRFLRSITTTALLAGMPDGAGKASPGGIPGIPGALPLPTAPRIPLPLLPAPFSHLLPLLPYSVILGHPPPRTSATPRSEHIQFLLEPPAMPDAPGTNTTPSGLCKLQQPLLADLRNSSARTLKSNAAYAYTYWISFGSSL